MRRIDGRNCRSVAIALGVLCSASQWMSAWAAEDVYQKGLPKVALVIGNSPDAGSGTGVVVDVENRLVLTNYHVVATGSSARVVFRVHSLLCSQTFPL